MFKQLYLVLIIVPLLLGFISFATNKLYSLDKYKEKILKLNAYSNFIYLLSFFMLFIITLYGVFKLNLLSGKEYYGVIGGWSKAMGIELKYNLIRSICIISIFLIACVFFATNLSTYITSAFRGFVCIMICGANGIIITNDIFNSYVFFEIVCITNYIIYAHGNNKECATNTFNYMILSSFAGIIFLLVAGILYQISGNLNIDLINKVITKYDNNKSINAIFVLFILAMVFKLGVYPLHNILANIYQHLDTNKLLVVAGVSSIAYPIFVMKIIIDVFGQNVLANNEYMHIVLKLCGGIGFIFFNILAVSGKKMKNFIISLAFAQTSFFVFCIPYLDNKEIKIGLVFAIISHAMLKVCLFALLYVLQKAFSFENINKKDVMYIDSKIYKYLIVLLLFFISGMPLSIVFMSKWYILSGFINSSTSIIWLMMLILGFTLDIIACFSFIMNALTANNSDRIVSMNKNKDIALFIAIITIILFIVLCTFYSNSFKFISKI